MPEKTRRPSIEMSHADYLTWIKNARKWLDGRVGESDYPAYLAAGFGALVDAYAITAKRWDALRSAAKGKNKTLVEAYKKLRKQIILIKRALPTLTDEEPLLGRFGLDRRIPRNRGGINTIAKTCTNNWDELCDPDPPPMYQPMQSDFEKLKTLFVAFADAREDYFRAIMAARQAQNDLLEARAALHKAERKLFRWYRAHHPNTRGEWWTGTWWGASRG